MAKAVGTIKAQLQLSGLTNVQAFRIGKFWGVNQAASDSPYYTITHLDSGLALIHYVTYRRACRLVGVLDVLLPYRTHEEVCAIWPGLPPKVRQALLD